MACRAGAAVAAAHARRSEEMRQRSGRAAGSGRAGRQSGRSQASVVRKAAVSLHKAAHSQVSVPMQLLSDCVNCSTYEHAAAAADDVTVS